MRETDRAGITTSMHTKEYFMERAWMQACAAARADEVPIGAVIVKDGVIVARAHNMKEHYGCANEHAEIVAIRRACKKLGDWRLEGCDIYVTLEPCPMCAGALIQARIEHIYFGAYDPKAGCCGSLYNLPQDTRFNHRCAVEGGILQEQCARILSDYFRSKRRKS